MAKRLLLLDDERDITELTRTLLGFHGFEVETLNDAPAVAAALQAQRYDLIVTDLMMPELSGFDLIQKIRQTPGYEQTPLVALSAKRLSDEERKFLFQQKVHFMAKPFEPRQLVESIRQLLTS